VGKLCSTGLLSLQRGAPDARDRATMSLHWLSLDRKRWIMIVYTCNLVHWTSFGTDLIPTRTFPKGVFPREMPKVLITLLGSFEALELCQVYVVLLVLVRCIKCRCSLAVQVIS
jgi:hypothetical protein